jgi:curved DNA-binding protein CbpA
MAPIKIMDDYYAVLEVASTTTIDDITKSYRRLALLRHPDRNPKDPKATANFQLVCHEITIPEGFTDNRYSY